MATMISKRVLFEDGSDDSDVSQTTLKVNLDYAQRFQHNKKREEAQKLEESLKRNDRALDSDDEAPESESEDEAGVLATQEIDAEISEVLTAIKNKDPRLRDKNYQWYKSIGKDSGSEPSKTTFSKPVTLRDYHRINLLADRPLEAQGSKHTHNAGPKSYVQEQEEIQREIAQELADREGDSDDDEDFFYAKRTQKPQADHGVHPSRAQKIQATGPLPDPETDPDGFLWQYSASRAWVDQRGVNWEAFTSDDDQSEDERMDEIEHAFNMRFEDPQQSNTVIRSYARGDKSVRRDNPSGRKVQREQEKLRKLEKKKAVREDRARLRRLKIEETRNKLQKIKEAAGISDHAVDEDGLMELLEDAWDNDRWEQVMAKRFDEHYYAAADSTAIGQSVDGVDETTSRPRKPKWDNDIDVEDLVSDLEEGIQLGFVEAGESIKAQDSEEEVVDGPAKFSSRQTNMDKKEVQGLQLSRRERARVGNLVDVQMSLDEAEALPSQEGGVFKYRETSPLSFGLTTRDILLAPSDAVLNEFASLKKYATWRDPGKKQQDRKKLGKKSRLRSWRTEVYGDSFSRSGPTFGFEKLVGEVKMQGNSEKKRKSKEAIVTAQGITIKSKKRRRRKNKGPSTEGDGME